MLVDQPIITAHSIILYRKFSTKPPGRGLTDFTHSKGMPIGEGAYKIGGLIYFLKIFNS